MGRYQMLMRFAALLVVFSVPLSFQASAQGGDPPRRALVVINTAYSKLPRPPVDDGGAKALADALRDAHFEVEMRENLDLQSLIEVLDKFQLSVQSGDVCFFYYSGYSAHELDTNYLVPVDYDPDSNGEIYDRAYSITRLERGVAKNSPFLSMVVLDASWDTPRLSGQAGLTEPTPPPHTWEFASTGPNQITTEMSGKMGFFTKALVETLPQHGLDLTDLVSKVTSNVELASRATQHARFWSTFGSKFYFHLPDPSGERSNGNDRLKYVYIPSGKFWMGCAPASETECNPSEKPRHRVEITRGFWLGKTEVTNLAYKRFAEANKIRFRPKSHITDAGKGDNLPVVDVSWADAQKYCQWTAKGGRLPTEAEWERAARGPKEDAVYPYPDLNTSRLYANLLGRAGNDRFDDIAPVEQFNPNDYNLFDMAGNVWEWVSDQFSATYYAESSKDGLARDPQGPAQADKGKGHVARGGSWASDAKRYLRISYRMSFTSGGNEVGFRCVVPDTPEAKKSFVN